MLNVLSAGCFAGFLLLVVRAVLAAGGGEARHRRAVHALILYALAVSLGAGLTQHDAWPFAKWPMAGGPADPEGSNVRVVALDDSGAEQAVDARAWQPLGFDELNPWMYRTFPRLPHERQQQAAAFLVAVAESARRRALADGGVGTFDRLLGPLTAPYFDLHPRVWSGATAPPRPFVGLRVYRERWNQEARRRDPHAVERVLVFEYRP